MMSPPSPSLRLSLAAVLAGLLSAFFGSTPTQAALLTYDASSNLGWFATNAWDSGTSTWTSGDSAVVEVASTTAVSLNASTNVANLTLGGAGGLSFTGTTSVRVLQMSGGNLSVTNNLGGVIIGSLAVIQGDYTFDTNGWLRLNNSSSQAYVGTATVQTGRIHYTHPTTQIGADSNFIITGGEVAMERSGADMGTLTLNSGSLILGRSSTTGHTFTITTTRLEGNGASAKIQTQGNPTTPSIQTFAVNQSDDTTYAGKILGTPVTTSDSNRLEFQKAGVGDLTLTGELDLRRTTTVADGRLYINSTGTNASFTNEAGTDAILVSGGSLGGTGTINITGSDNVSLGAGGSLTAGLAGGAGKTTFQFDGGNLNLSLATASANTGWLRFDLGSSATPGTNYDQIDLLGGNLNIGTGLNFSDFDFTALAGFGAGNYVLFQTPGAIFGSLGTTTGVINGFDTTLSISGNNLVLTSVPEPSNWALFGGSLLLLALLRRLRA